MKKFLLYTLLATILSSSLIYAETPNHIKSYKKSDTNKTMGNDEFMKEFTKLNQEIEASRKESQKLDELGNMLGIKYKWKILF